MRHLHRVLFQPKSGKFTSPVLRLFIRTPARRFPRTTPGMFCVVVETGVIGRRYGSLMVVARAVIPSPRTAFQCVSGKQSMANYQPFEI
jgi:hypothetical protein